MKDATFVTAQNLKTSLAFLDNIKTELATASTQKVVFLKQRSLPTSPPAALTTALGVVEDFLVAQAKTAIQDQIDALQLSFDDLQDPDPGSGS